MSNNLSEQLSNLRGRTELFVHVDVGAGAPVVAAKVQVSYATNSCRFVYGKSYLANPLAFALDPINLPLDNKVKTFLMSRFNPTGLPGVLLDGGPDGWGKRVLNRVLSVPPQNDLDYLVLGSGTGVGALLFSDSASPVTKRNIPQGVSLDELGFAARAFDSDASDEEIPSILQECFIGTTAVGGARPKTQIIQNNIAYIAKFNRDIDTFNNAATEFAIMRCMKFAGINVANVNLADTDIGSVLLVERFDSPMQQQDHFISANSLLNIQTLEQSTEEASYIAIGDLCRKLTVDRSQVFEFFKRMIFNIAIGCTDDHTRNHGFIKRDDSTVFSLSPAYDVVPFPERIGSHAISLGDYGMTPSRDNVLSVAKRLGFNEGEYRQAIQDVFTALAELPELLEYAGLSDKDRLAIEPCFRYQAMLRGLLT